MDKVEKTLRLGSLTEMHLAFGKRIDADQLRVLANLTRSVPVDVFREACQLAAITTEGGWPPGPGDVLRSALKLSPGKSNPGRAPSLPRWFQKATFQVRGGETPREIGTRGLDPGREIARVVEIEVVAE